MQYRTGGNGVMGKPIAQYRAHAKIVCLAAVFGFPSVKTECGTRFSRMSPPLPSTKPGGNGTSPMLARNRYRIVRIGIQRVTGSHTFEDPPEVELGRRRRLRLGTHVSKPGSTCGNPAGLRGRLQISGELA